MKVKDIFEAFIPRDGAIDERDADHEVRIVVHAPGSLGGTPSVGLSGRGIQVGFDWDHGKLLLNPEVPLTRLTPEDVAAIHESVKKGQSWHAYQAHKQAREKHSEQLQQCKEEIARLKAENAELIGVVHAYEAARDSLFVQCLSNPIKNAWGKEVDVSLLNQAHEQAGTVIDACQRRRRDQAMTKEQQV